MDGKAGVLVAEDASDAFAAANSLRNLLILVSLAVALVVGIFAWQMTDRIARPLAEAAELAERLAVGDTEHDIRIVSGSDETGRLNGALRRLLGYMRELTGASEKVAAGNMDIRLAPKSERDELSKAFITVARVNSELIGELGRITRSASNGELDARANAGAFAGSYRELVDGVNRTLDAVIEPIHEASSVLERLATRDLTARMVGSYRGDHAKIKQALNTALERLDGALAEVAASSEQLSDASGEIADGGQSLARGAAEQATSLGEVSTSLEEVSQSLETMTASLRELSAMTRQNAGSAREARTLAEGARSSAAEGVASMERLCAAINGMKQSSDATAKIVKTIDEIAFQTNLLALNAAVEAARAGDAGRGFAVVAEEVRSLALRSAEAARTTASLIEESVRSADGGVTLSGTVVKQLGEIDERITRMSGVMAEIAAASEQQSKGVAEVASGVTQISAGTEQITVAVGGVSRVTQQSAASSERSASTAVELASQAGALRHTLVAFTLTGSAATRTASRGRRSAPARSAPRPELQAAFAADEEEGEVAAAF